MEVSTAFIPQDTHTSLPVAASTDIRGKGGSRRCDGGDTLLKEHDLTKICYPHTLVCSHFFTPISFLSLLQEPRVAWMVWMYWTNPLPLRDCDMLVVVVGPLLTAQNPQWQ